MILTRSNPFGSLTSPAVSSPSPYSFPLNLNAIIEHTSFSKVSGSCLVHWNHLLSFIPEGSEACDACLFHRSHTFLQSSIREALVSTLVSPVCSDFLNRNPAFRKPLVYPFPRHLCLFLCAPHLPVSYEGSHTPNSCLR